MLTKEGSRREPSADPGASPASGYLWLYRFLHTTAGNITTAFGSKTPGLKVLVPLVMILLLLLSTPACAARYTIHPGALSKTDSAAYDTLLVAETLIDQARADYPARRLPAGASGALNTLIQSYNFYHGGARFLAYLSGRHRHTRTIRCLLEPTRDKPFRSHRRYSEIT